MRIRISPQQTQKTILAPHMKQSIEILLLPIMDLNTAIEQELESNPLLEKSEEKDPADLEEFYQKYFRQDGDRSEIPYERNMADDEPDERPIKGIVCLEERLLQQLRVEVNDPLEVKIGELIIGNLDEDGYLGCTLEEIAQMANCQDMVLITNVLKMIQRFEPVGVASRDLKECLSVQAQVKGRGRSALIARIIEKCFEELSGRKIPDIAKKLGVPLNEIKDACQVISNFEPKPARNHRPIEPNIYVTPDIFITKDTESKYQIRMNNEGVPRLRINPYYKKMLTNNHLTATEKEFIKEKLKNALIFMKSLEQRNQTIFKITQYILDKQKEFFENGHMGLVPMTLKDVAERIERNESTISRAINNKFMDTPSGTFPFKFFFSAEVSNDHGNGGATAVASRSVKEELRDLIDHENRRTPLSDAELQEYFEQKGIKIARRTLAKYRQALHILPSHLRKG